MARTRSLYLIRHAIAADRGDSYPDDTLRPLTREGIQRWKRQVRGLQALGLEIDLVLTSPLARAKQTAEILAAGLFDRPAVETLETLSPGASTAATLQSLHAHEKARHVALVGHEPEIGALAARLLGAKGTVPFKKGAVCRIDVDGFPPSTAGTLCWFLPPKVLRTTSR
jgi:phosphohistidine phosphatase